MTNVQYGSAIDDLLGVSIAGPLGGKHFSRQQAREMHLLERGGNQGRLEEEINQLEMEVKLKRRIFELRKELAQLDEACEGDLAPRECQRHQQLNPPRNVYVAGRENALDVFSGDDQPPIGVFLADFENADDLLNAISARNSQVMHSCSMSGNIVRCATRASS